MNMKLTDTLRAGMPVSSPTALQGYSFHAPLRSPRKVLKRTFLSGSKRFPLKKETQLLSGHESIPEEEIDMTLQSSAMPWTTGWDLSTAYIMEEENREREYKPIVPPTAPHGTSSSREPRVNAQIKEASRHELNATNMGDLKAETTRSRASSTSVPPENGISQSSTCPGVGSSSIRGLRDVRNFTAWEQRDEEIALREEIERSHTMEEARSTANRRRAVEKKAIAAAATQISRLSPAFLAPRLRHGVASGSWPQYEQLTGVESGGRAIGGGDQAPRRPRPTHWQEQPKPVQRALLRGANSQADSDDNQKPVWSWSEEYSSNIGMDLLATGMRKTHKTDGRRKSVHDSSNGGQTRSETSTWRNTPWLPKWSRGTPADKEAPTVKNERMPRMLEERGVPVKGYTMPDTQGNAVPETRDTSRSFELQNTALKFAAQLGNEEPEVLADLVLSLRME